MDLLMKNIHMCRQTKRTSTQITLDDDLNVPDIRPDVEMIIQSRERVNLEHTRVENGKLYVGGYMDVSILYMDDTKERQLFRLDTKLNFDECINMENLETGDNVRIRYETEDLNVTLINSRKLAIRGLLSVEVSVDEIYDLSAAVEVQTPVVLCERRKRLDLMQLEVQKKDIFRLKETAAIPANKPDIREILWDYIQIRNCRIQLREGKLGIQGLVFFFVLYRGEDEKKSHQWLEQTIPFEGELACSGCVSGLIPEVELLLTQSSLSVREDTDGEMRLLHLEGVLELEIRLYRNEEVEILEDVYSPEKQLEVTVSEEQYERLVMKNESRCKTTGKIRIHSAKPRILQICHSNGTVKIDQTRILSNGIQIEGALLVSILYISSDDAMPFAVLEGSIPFSHVADVPGITEDCRFTLSGSLDQLTAAMSDSEEIEVRAQICLNVMAVQPLKQECIREIEEKDYTLEQLQAVPGFTGYFVQEGETLWDIGKKYFLTPSQIAEVNGLETEEIKAGDCLILMKQVIPFRHFS